MVVVVVVLYTNLIHIRYVYLKEQCFLVALSLDTEMLDWSMVKTKTLSWKKWKACSLSLKEMFRICNLAVKHFSLFQKDSDVEDYERTCAMEILPLKKFKRFLYYLLKKWLQNCNKIEKQLTLNHFYQPVFMPMKSQYYQYLEVRCSPLFSILGNHFIE